MTKREFNMLKHLPWTAEIRQLLVRIDLASILTNLRILWGFIRPHRATFIRLLLVNVFLVFFEANTLTLIALGVAVVTEADISGVTTSLGFAGDWLQLAVDSYPPGVVFGTIIVLAVLAQLMRAWLTYASVLQAGRLNQYIVTNVQTKIMQRALYLPQRALARYNTADMTSYLVYADNLSVIVLNLNGLFQALILSFGYFLVLVWLSATLSGFLFVLVLGTGIFVWRLLRAIRQVATRHREAAVTQHEQGMEIITGMHLIRLLNREGVEFERYSQLTRDNWELNFRALAWSFLSTPIIQSIAILFVAMFMLGGYFLIQGDAILPRLLTFVLVLWRWVPRFSDVSEMGGQLSAALPYLTYIFDMLERDEDIKLVDHSGAPYNGLQTALTLDNVSLAYPGSENEIVVRDVSLTIPRGHTVAVVGYSGSGKTSLLHLLTRAYDPTVGHVLADGVDIATLDLHDWRAKIGYVRQDIFLFNRSILENIRYARPDASDEEVYAAAQQANAHDFIVGLEDGYGTIVGERGTRLSGGQRQRIGLARALLQQADILILDEATSNLDSHSERLIQSALQELHGKKTIVLVAHRLSTVNTADNIIVMDAGHVVEQGTHADLIAADGPYAELWRLQSTVSEKVTKA